MLSFITLVKQLSGEAPIVEALESCFFFCKLRSVL